MGFHAATEGYTRVSAAVWGNWAIASATNETGPRCPAAFATLQHGPEKIYSG
jgi:hypothetical protein